MYTIPPKKMLTLNILDILRKHTNSEHRLTQKQIVNLLESEHQMTVERKAVKRNLMNLIDFGYDIGYSETKRRTKDGTIEVIASDWYINREFEDSELRLLIDSLLFSHQIPSTQGTQLIDKLKGLSSRYFNTRVKHVLSLPEVTATNRQLFYTIDVLDEAISTARQVAFKYGSFDTSGVLLPRLDDNSNPRTYHIDPYQMVAANSRYYLICRNAPHDTLAYYRIDRIINIELLETPVKPIKDLPGFANGLDLPRHMAEHVYMFSGDSATVRFRINRAALMHVFDWFGNDVRFTNTTNDTVDVTVRVNQKAMLYWSLQFGEHVEVLDPPSLRAQLHAAAQKIADKYRQI
ncbi:MAG: WYL domain-containing protein [Coriobacteriales bacterium]|jgi:predicted DNA-binding transcriptional regulator YafY|nr:WYL domain-containing protein [Coriobacteriales bacterium]